MKKSLVFLFVLIFSFPSSAEIYWSRCPEMESLDGKQAKGRWAWFERCYPDKFLDAVGTMYTKKDGNERMTYPIFGVFKKVNNRWKGVYKKGFKAPKTKNAACNLPKGYKVISYCVAGCYTPDQQIFFSNSSGQTLELDRQGFEWERPAQILTLSSSSSLENPLYEASPYAQMVESVIDAEEEILVIQTVTGGQLKVTPNHPLVVSSGEMKQAQDLTVGDSLVTMSGSFDPILSVKKTTFLGKVWNIDVGSKNPENNIIVGQGYLNGDMSFQNEFTKHLGERLVRVNIPEELTGN